ncbi:lactoylglutathione lyase-like lyase [Leptolyngbya sp. PCC 7375]|nr:lactoylglutathione lyase-like lyase [Leptolyngbya sp. PCC 7375]
MLNVTLLKIPVTDLQQSVKFYESVLGLSARYIVEEYGWAQLDGATVAIALYVPGRGGGQRSPGGSVDFHLGHSQLDELKRRASNVTKTVAIHNNNDGSRSLEFLDPDGNEIKIMETL